MQFSTSTTRPTAPPSSASLPNMPLYYVPIPHRMVEDLRNAPVAIGAFALVARIFRITREPVAISPHDLQLFDPQLSYGAAYRALKRLRETGWLLATDIGRKKAYTPTWGLIGGNTRTWDLAAASLGRPRHINALRLDQRLLDVCIGRLTPNLHHPAIIRRYLHTPLLGLSTIGDYALALGGITVHSSTLEDLHLLSDGQALPLPDNATILAIASQRETIGLTSAGWAQTSFGPPAATPVRPSSGQALFFVPVEQIGPMIGEVIADMIGDDSSACQERNASESSETLLDVLSQASHGVMEKSESTTTHSVCIETVEGGGGEIPSDRAQPSAEPASKSSRLLQEIGVRRSVATALAEHPVSQIARVISQARARSDIRDLAAWVVSALRDLPAEEPASKQPARPVSPMPIYIHPGLSDEQRDRWIWRYHRAETLFDKQQVLEQLAEQHPLEEAS